MDPNDTEQSYLISRFIESYFSNQVLVDEKRIHRFILCGEGGSMEQTTIFVQFLNVYQSYRNISRIINHLFSDLAGYCNHENTSIRKNALQLLGILASAKSIAIFDEQLAKILNRLFPSMHAIGFDALGGENLIVEYFLNLIKLNLKNVKKIVFLNSKIQLKDKELFCLIL